MKRIFLALALVSFLAAGCGPMPTPPQTLNGGRPGPTPVTMPALTYIVPLDAGLIHRQGLIEDLVFPTASQYGYGTQTQQPYKLLGMSRTMTVTRYRKDALDTLFAKLASDRSLVVERRISDTTNTSFGAGKRYYVNVTDTRSPADYKVTLQPVKSETYQDDIVFPLPVPGFEVSDLQRYLLSTEIFYRHEINSAYNSESVHANFVRLLKSAPFSSGDRDPVTGKIFTQQFSLPYRGQEVLFTLETFPYRNGSKAVMYLRVPAILTAPNTVDYRIMIEEIKAELNKIVQS